MIIELKENDMKRIISKVIFGVVLLSLPLSACSFSGHRELLETTLENEQSDLAKIEVSSVIPQSEKIAIVCPYSGDKANEAFRTSAFKGYEAEHEENNWIVFKDADGEVVKEEFYRTEVDMCTIGFDGVKDIRPEDVLIFERNSYAWILSDIERKNSDQ